MALLKFKRSATPSKVPTTSDLSLGELAMNTFDGKLYMKKDDGTQAIVEIGAASGGGTWGSITGTLSNQTDLWNALSAKQDSSTALTTTTSFGGDVSGTYNNIIVADDSHNHIIANVDGLQTALDGKEPTITILPVSKGGTGTSSLTSGYVLKGNGTSPVTSSVIYDSGTNVGIGTASPDSKVDIEAAHSQLRLTDSDDSKFVLFSYSGGKLITRNNSTTTTTAQFTLDESGRIGIGTISPSQTLQVQGTGYATSDFRAPIFYDSDNTAYFLNPTGGGSTINGMISTGRIDMQSTDGYQLESGKHRITYNDGGGNFNIRVGHEYDSGNVSTENGYAGWIEYTQSNGLWQFWTSDASVTTGNAVSFNEAIRISPTAVTLYYDGASKLDTTSTGISVTGTGAATSDFRAPRFYDSDNTAYYVDPASTSALNGLTSYGDLIISKADARLKLYDSTGTSGNNPYVEWETTANQGIAMELNVYDGELPVSGYGLVVREGPSNGQFPTTGTLTFNVLGEMYAGGTTLGSLNKVFHDGYHPNADTLTTARTISLTGDATGSVSFNGSANVSISTTVVDDSHGHSFNNLLNKTGGTGTYQTSGSFRAPIFYDSNNTAYYTDPASTSILNIVSATSANVDKLKTKNGNYLVISGGESDAHATGQTGEIIYMNSEGGVEINSSPDNWASGWAGRNTATICDTSGNSSLPAALTLAGSLTVSNGNIYGPQYINMRYGVSGAGGVRLYDSDGTLHGYWYGDGSGRGGLLDNDGQWAVKVGIGTEGLRLYCNNNEEFIVNTNHTLSTGSSRAPIFYDSNNTNFYINPNGTSNCNDIKAENLPYAKAGSAYGTENTFTADGGVGANNITRSMFYRDNNGQFGALGVSITHATSANYALQIACTSYSTNTGTFKFRLKNNGTWTGATTLIDDGTANQIKSGYLQSNSNLRAPIFYDSNNTGRYADLASTGDSIRASGDIVAYYSDDRLKDRGDNIANALDKVQSLNGFHYTANDTAQKFGYKANPQVGVSAQEVEAVLPEVVKDAAIGHGYKTVDYAKLVPLLIEAIKELKAEVETLRAEAITIKHKD